ncbi:MAG: cation transporter [Planctomycetaceae bacterium]|nr:MAG: cation transporter [Planctomycetaceae bacterium]
MTKSRCEREPARGLVAGRLVYYSLAWAVLWWLINKGDLDSWLVGLPTVLAAATISTWLAPPSVWRWTLRGIPRFVWYFGRSSIEGGFDVAWRAVHPGLPIEPGVIEYPIRLPQGTARVFFANAISLCPGTVSMQMREDRLLIHVLDMGQPVHQRLGELERVVSVLFGVESALDERAAGRNA